MNLEIDLAIAAAGLLGGVVGYWFSQRDLDRVSENILARLEREFFSHQRGLTQVQNAYDALLKRVDASNKWEAIAEVRMHTLQKKTQKVPVKTLLETAGVTSK